MESQLPLFEEISPSISAKNPIESNRRFCKEIEETLLLLGYEESKSESPELNSFNKRNAYEDMYGSKRQSSFLVNSNQHGLVRVEAHRQETSGSVDQKFPFFFESLMKAPESNLVIVFDGKGYKEEAYDWLLTETAKVQDKTFLVFPTKEEFCDWLINKTNAK
ncbi:PD-(D/E)XK nuclease superfamily protein [Pseudoalteromonas sp. T1lg88]|uniref:PD-(D/E)XK nuclease superfamily protein n=1 Tax=Pseudoalteromonas sp. T1lg88 TaxID=2077104 RepID=UPI000CF74CF2|nr:PD-(D/E)XK nuclease superfamily protein [Pseudoalteromonas sp. T1lg88]